MWGELVSAWSLGAIYLLSCSAWALASALFFSVVLLHLMLELKRQKKHSTRASSSAGADIDPIWSEAAQHRTDTEALATSRSSRRSVLQRGPGNASPFFPPFEPAPAVYTDPTNVMWLKVKHNILATGFFAMMAFTLTGGVSLKDYLLIVSADHHSSPVMSSNGRGSSSSNGQQRQATLHESLPHQFAVHYRRFDSRWRFRRELGSKSRRLLPSLTQRLLHA